MPTRGGCRAQRGKGARNEQMPIRPVKTSERDRNQTAPLKHENTHVRTESRGKEEVREGTDEPPKTKRTRDPSKLPLRVLSLPSRRQTTFRPKNRMKSCPTVPTFINYRLAIATKKRSSSKTKWYHRVQSEIQRLRRSMTCSGTLRLPSYPHDHYQPYQQHAPYLCGPCHHQHDF